MRLAAALAVLVPACASEPARSSPPPPTLELQPSYLDEATDDGWNDENTILVGDASTLSFPRGLALRVSSPSGLRELIVSNIDARYLETEAAPFCRYAVPDEAPDVCYAGFRITAPGVNIVAVSAVGLETTTLECFYFAIVDPSTDVDALRVELDGRVAACGNHR